MMITCENCGKEQSPGNFCESCGAPLEAQTERTVTDNQTLEKVKQQSSQYWAYAVERIKNPTIALKDGSESFANAVITAILLPLFLSILLYALANNVVQQQMSMFTDGRSLPFFLIVSRLFIFFVILLFTGLIASAISLKIAKNRTSFQMLFTRFSGLQVPYTMVYVVLALLALAGIFSLNLNSFGNNVPMFVLLNVIFVILTVIHPVILTYSHVKQEEHPHAYYMTILSFVINLLILYIFTFVLLDGMLRSLEQMFMW